MWLLVGAALLVGLGFLILDRRRAPFSPPAANLPVAGAMVGDSLLTPDGSDIGVVTDVVMHVQTGEAQYLIVELKRASAGRAMTEEQPRYLALPWSMVRPGNERDTILVTVDRTTLFAAPRTVHPPDTRVEGWDAETTRYWALHPAPGVP
jgi:sporulation protein YlmC with PRC-barrel domain